MLRYHFIKVCSIFDEIALLNRYAKDDKYLKDTLYAISPARRAIEKFTGIRKARNLMLAHFNRDTKKNFKPFWVELKEIKLPDSIEDISLMFIWLQVINSILVSRYYEELREISNEFRPELDNYTHWAKNERIKTIELTLKLEGMRRETEERLTEIGLEDLKMEPMMADFINNKTL